MQKEVCETSGGLRHLSAVFKGLAINQDSVWYPSLALLVLSSRVGLSNAHLLPISRVDAVMKGSRVFLQRGLAGSLFSCAPQDVLLYL